MDGRGSGAALVLFAIQPESKWLDAHLERLIGEARHRYPNANLALDVYRDFGSLNRIRARIEAFQLPDAESISYDVVRDRLGGSKAICIVAAGRPSILDALSRSGVPSEAINEFFDEEIIATGMNSNLMQRLEAHVKNYGHMLYAWGSLRTSSKGLVQGFRRKGMFIEAESAAKVVAALCEFLWS